MSDHLTESQIMSWLDGELPPAEADSTRRHLESCAQCVAQVARWQTLFEGIAGVEPIRLQHSMAPAVLSQLKARPRLGRRLAWLAAIQLALGALVVGYLLTAPNVLAWQAELGDAGFDPSDWWAGLAAQAQAEAIALGQELQMLAQQAGLAMANLDVPSTSDLPWLGILAAVGLLWLVTNGWLLRQEQGWGRLLTGSQSKEARNG